MDSSSFTELSPRRPVHIPIVLICVNRLLVGGEPTSCALRRATTAPHTSSTCNNSSIAIRTARLDRTG
jgi:hypothetical protein